MSYSVAAWNINRKTEKDETFYDKIATLMQNKNIDIFFLTEVAQSHKNVIEKRLEKQENLDYKIKEISQIEYIIVLIKKDRFNKINFAYEEDGSRISSVEVKLRTKQKEEFTIRGVRFHTQCTRHEFKEQVSSFIKAITERQIDIVIGDYNWASTIGRHLDMILGYYNEWKSYKEDSKKILDKLLSGKSIELPNEDLENEVKLCKLINDICAEENCDCDYDLQPQTKCGYYSAKTVNHKGIIYSNPDRVLWNKMKIEAQENRINYIPKLLDKDEFPKEWTSDHSILLFMFSIKESK